ncbi:AI-2E family transporter [Thermogemmatispora onikobensis]|uniref:AI-2E family transporter n=1 Tax=Thermogemmatispora onikobensis TaxID=732234 RepID=UPI000852FC76|nr:AI-2E family transporter [Thermogemmatispora onikobensis]
MERVNWQRVRDVLISIVCICILGWLGWSISGLFLHALVLLLLAMAIAFLVSPLVDRLQRFGLPRSLATLLVYAVVLVVVGSLFYALLFALIRQAQTFSVTIQNYAYQLPELSAKLQKFLVDQGIPQEKIDSVLTQIEVQATDFARSLVNNIVGFLFTLTDLIVNVVLVTVLSFYLTLDGKRIRDSLFKVMPRRSLPHFLLFEDALNRVVGNYIRGQLTLAVIIGVLAGLGCATPWLGLRDYALIVGALAFLFETIPMVGPALASLPAVAISLLLPEPFPRTFVVIGYFVIIQIVESNVLGPRIVGHAVGLHPVASILALIIGAQLFGAFGALIATPIVAAAWVVVTSIYRSLVKGESAEQILTSRRQPWVLRRRRTQQQPGLTGEARAAQGLPVTSEEILERGMNRVSAAPAIKKGIDLEEKIEQLDLLRPFPEPQEQRHTVVQGEQQEQDEPVER